MKYTYENFLAFILKVNYPIKFYLFFLCVISFFFALETSLKPYLIKLFINAATIKDAALLSSGLYKIAFYIILIQFFIHLFKRLSTFYHTKIELYFKGEVLKNIFDQVLSKDYVFFESRQTGEISFNIAHLTHSLQIIIISGIQLVTNIIAVIIAFVFLYYVNPIFGFSILIWACSVILIASLTLRNANVYINGLSKICSLIEGNITDVLSNISNIILFCTAEHESERLSDFQKEHKIKIKKHRMNQLKFYSIQGVIFIIYQITCLWSLIFLYTNKKISIGDFALIISTNLAILDRLWGLADQMSLFVDNWLIAKNTTKTFYKCKKTETQEASLMLCVNKGTITFDKVSFYYKHSEKKIFFNNQSIHIDGGQKVGLVGYSGAGKSTFVNLITRLHDITSGRIFIDDQDIKNVTKKSLRNAITAIHQEMLLFNRNVMENIKYGKLEATESEIVEASKKAHIHDFILTLPEGYKTVIGKNGLCLSGGQRQRILIARAVLKNSPIIIFDEPTSQLDYITEKNILKSLHQFMEGKTVLVIAHRLITLSFMDRILIFENGKIVEDGPPKELLRKNSMYQKFLST